MNPRESIPLLLLVLAPIARAQSQVVLSEIMFDAFGSDNHDEFIEIVNLSETASLDLSGWQISDGTGTDNIIEVTGGSILKPGQFGVILDASYFENSHTYDDLIPASGLILTIDNRTFGSGGLRNLAPETVSLMNSSGEVVSEYRYSTDNPMGFSDEKIDLTGPNTRENWANSRALFGTPGGPNSVTPLNYDLALFPEDIQFSPNTIQTGETVSISAKIRNLGKLPATGFSVVFFEDTDADSLAEAGEELLPLLNFGGPLQPGDSTIAAIEYPDVLPGSHLIGARIEFPQDNDNTNNQALKGFLVGYATRTAVMNEIMYSPLSNQPEWIELFNLASQPIDLNQWRISDSDIAAQVIINQHILLSSNSYYVLAEDSSLLDIFNPPPGSFSVLRSWPSLNNNMDSIVLFDLIGTEIDRVNYSESWGGNRGISLEKINPGLTSNDSSNWSSSVAFAGGTPGEQNSLFTTILPPKVALTVEPNPFSPDGDGEDDFAVISYELPLNTAVTNVKIYDLRGRLIRFLANNQPSGSQNAVIWDGRDNRGQMARIGIYVVFLQALNAEAGVLKTEKKTVVLAGKL